MTTYVPSATYASIEGDSALYAPQINGLVAGEDLTLLAPCRIHTDGKVYLATTSYVTSTTLTITGGSVSGSGITSGTVPSYLTNFDGICSKAVKTGMPVTLFGVGTIAHIYDSAMTIGAGLYAPASASAGWYMSTAQVVGDLPIARTVNAYSIRIVR